MKKIVRKIAAGVFLGGLSVSGAVASVVGITSMPVMAQTTSYFTKDVMKPTRLQFNTSINGSFIEGEGDHEYFYYFKTDDSKKPYQIELFNNQSSYETIFIKVYERNADSNVDRDLDRRVGVNSRGAWTLEDLKSDTEYIVYIDTYNNNKNYNWTLQVKHEISASDNYTGVKYYKNKWVYFKNGSPDYSYTGVARSISGNWVFVRKGVFDNSYNGVARSTTGNWVYVKNGRYYTGYTGVAQSTTGNWVYVKNGRYYTGATGIARSTSGNYVYVKNGRFNSSYTGLTNSLATGKLIYSKNGRFDSTKNGYVYYNGNSYYVRNGRV